ASFCSYFHDGNIKCSSSKIEDTDLFIFIFSFSVVQCCGSWFVDNSFYFESSDFSSYFGSISLAVVKVGRYCDNCLCYWFSQEFFCVLFDFLEDKCRDLFWFVFFTIDNEQTSTV